MRGLLTTMHDWRGLEEFVAVVEHGSFTKAAYALGLSKSYVSKTVSELEARLGVQLLFRSTRRVSLTSAGEIFYERCNEMRHIYADVERQLGAFQERPTGRLRIGLCDVYGVSFMAAIVAEFGGRYPEVSLEVIAYLNEKELVHGDYDVVIRYGQLPDSEMKISRIGYLSYGLVASHDYIAAHGWPKNVEELSAHSCLSDPSGFFYFNNSDDVRPLKVRVSGQWVSNSAIALGAASLRGLGIAQVPISTVLDPLRDGSMGILEQDWAFYDQEVWISFQPGITAAATRAFVDFLTSRFSKIRQNYRRPASYQALDRLRSGIAA